MSRLLQHHHRPQHGNRLQQGRHRLRLIGCMCALLSGFLALPVHAADPEKVLRYVFVAPENGFDPAVTNDLYSAVVVQSIFETLYSYDYLARPAKLMPLAAQDMPEISADGKTYTIRLKQGIYFSADPVFAGKKRELIAADYVYAWKRLFDPRIRSPHAWLLAGRIEGLDEFVQRASQGGRFDYEIPVSGLEVLDRYTLRIHLSHADFNLGMILAHEPTSAVAREVIEKYQNSSAQVMDHPVGTGPYLLTKWVRGASMRLQANPGFRGMIWDFQPGADVGDQQIVRRMKGKRMPQIGRIEISVMPEDQSRWLAFQNDEIDLFQLEGPLAPQALQNGKLKPELQQKGVQLSRIIDPELSYTYWNMRDPVVGGLSKEKIALRRAIAMAYNVQQEIDVVWNGEAIALEYPIPPGVVGYAEHYKSTVQLALQEANLLLDKFGYHQGIDGWRMLPDGKTLLIRYATTADTLGQQRAEVWKKTYDQLHIRMQGDFRPFPDLLKAEKACQLQSRTAAWIADYPDGDNFMQLFYGPYSGQNNSGCMAIPEYDKLYLASQKMVPGAERDFLYRKMARLLEVYAPMRIAYARYRNMLAQPRVIGYKKHPILHAEWLYFDIEKR